MDHLRPARSSELQEFFNTYYVPNNAMLVDRRRHRRREDEGAGARSTTAGSRRARRRRATIPKEPEQTEARDVTVVTQPRAAAGGDDRVARAAVRVGRPLRAGGCSTRSSAAGGRAGSTGCWSYSENPLAVGVGGDAHAAGGRRHVRRQRDRHAGQGRRSRSRRCSSEAVADVRREGRDDGGAGQGARRSCRVERDPRPRDGRRTWPRSSARRRCSAATPTASTRRWRRSRRSRRQTCRRSRRSTSTPQRATTMLIKPDPLGTAARSRRRRRRRR